MVPEDENAPRPVGPTDSATTPGFAGPATFARLPRLDQVPKADIAAAHVAYDLVSLLVLNGMGRSR